MPERSVCTTPFCKDTKNISNPTFTTQGNRIKIETLTNGYKS